jgi:uncharacterized coiled-coil DUF342 family protein
MARAAKLEAIPTQERVSVLETKVEAIDEKLDDLKVDVKDMHDCLDRTRDQVNEKLDTMLGEYRSNRDKFFAHADELHKIQTEQHNELADKISDLEKFRAKWSYLILGGIAVLGWIGAYWETVVKILEQ